MQKTDRDSHKKSEISKRNSSNRVNEYEKSRKSRIKAYSKEYTEFNFRIDSILNEGYSFIKQAQPKFVPLSRINKIQEK